MPPRTPACTGFEDARADTFVAAFRQDGRFWERFGDGGVVRTDFGNDSAVASHAAVVDGGLVVVGGMNRDMFAARCLLGRR